MATIARYRSKGVQRLNPLAVRSGAGCVPGVLLFLVTFSSACQPTPSPDEIPWQKSFALGVERALAEDRELVVLFDASWCSICQRMQDTSFASRRVHRALANYVPVRIDVDEQPYMAQKFRIDAVPQLLILRSNGTELIRTAGFMDEEQLLSVLRPMQTKDSVAADGNTD